METSTTTIMDVKEALNEYFKLKFKYETQNNSNKKKIMNNNSLSNREKRTEFLKLKPKCINCNRPGGTIFKTLFFDSTDLNESYRQYTASCGIIVDPCRLDIKIQLGKVDLLPNLLNTIQSELTLQKNSVIDEKNKMLFGYTTTEAALNKFETLKDDISLYSSLYEDYINAYNDIVDNPAKKIELSEAITNYYTQIDQIKECIKKMNETNNSQYARDAATIYDHTLVPLMNKIRRLKYDENGVWHNEDTNTCKLIQNKYSIQQLSYSDYTDKVVSYKVGMEVEKKKRTDAFVIETDTSSEAVFEDEPNLIVKPTTSQTGQVAINTSSSQ
jgi:hypothetical protein